MFPFSEKKRLKEETEGRRESDGEKSDNEQLVVDVSNEVSTQNIPRIPASTHRI